MEGFLFPDTTRTDNIDFACSVTGYHLLKNINWKNAKPYFYLHSMWPSIDNVNNKNDLPPGYDIYFVSCHMEQIDFGWLQQQKVGPIVVLSDFKTYNEYNIPNVYFFRWTYWHVALDLLKRWFGELYLKDIKYKLSAFCNRCTQNKVVATMCAVDCIQESDRLVSVNGKWVEDKNMNYWMKTNNSVVDRYIDMFKLNYLNKEVRFDDFNNDTNNFQQYTGNPRHVAYQQCAINLNNESFEYSLMHLDGQQITVPGPHITEKTFKCLLGATAFLHVGQYDLYDTLRELGLKFDYNDISLNYDKDPGNITRAEKLTQVIKDISNMSADEIYNMTKQSSEYNHQQIVSGQFYRNCEQTNLQTVKFIQGLL